MQIDYIRRDVKEAIAETGSANFAGDTCVVTGTVDPARTDVTQGTVTKTLVGV